MCPSRSSTRASGGSRRSSSSGTRVDVVEHQAVGGREPAGQHGHAHRVVRPAADAGRGGGPRRRVRRRSRCRRPRSGPPRAGRSRGTAPRGRSAPSPPPTRPPRARGRCGATWNRCSTPGQYADVPAGDRDRRRRPEEVLDLVAVAGHGRSLLRAPGVEELQLGLRHPVAGAVRRAAAPPAGRRSRARSRSRGRASERRATSYVAPQRVVELDQVELTQLGERSLVLPLGMGVLAVLVVHRHQPGVQGEVHGPEADRLGQLGVVDLALLPARHCTVATTASGSSSPRARCSCGRGCGPSSVIRRLTRAR